MELMIGQLSQRTGVSTRMLRHYDELGLFRPSRLGSNGYRWYDERTLPRLYRIIALRRSGVSLAGIAHILDGGSNEADALRQHLNVLQAEQKQLAELVASIEAQIARLDGARIDDPEQFRADYRSEFSSLTERLQTGFPVIPVDSYATYAHAVEAMPPGGDRAYGRACRGPHGSSCDVG